MLFKRRGSSTLLLLTTTATKPKTNLTDSQRADIEKFNDASKIYFFVTIIVISVGLVVFLVLGILKKNRQRKKRKAMNAARISLIL